MNTPELNKINSVYGAIVGGGENIAHLLAVLDLSYSHFNIVEIHEAWVNLEDNTVDFYIDEPIDGLSIDDCLVIPPDDTEGCCIPGVMIASYNIPDISRGTLEGLLSFMRSNSQMDICLRVLAMRRLLKK